MFKRLLLACQAALLALLLIPTATQAQGISDPGAPLCFPGLYDEMPEGCLSLGPTAYLMRMAELGIVFPLRPLPTVSPDETLSEVPYYYLRVKVEEGRLYSSLDEAIVGDKVARYIEPGFDYVSYIDYRVIDGSKYYMVEPGVWMRGEDLSSRILPSDFMGLEFLATPSRKFGWVLEAIETQYVPGYAIDQPTGHTLGRWELVQVYDEQVIDERNWYMVGPDEWVDERWVSLVYPNSTPPEGVENGRWIEINLYEQSVAVYEGHRLVYATLVSSGLPGWWTRPGLFQITEKLESTPMSGALAADRSDYYYLADVPWTMYFDESRALHGAYWHDDFGYRRSHGCANLSVGDAHWLYDWAQLGDWVYVWDPSGNTPVDPEVYTAIGAY